METIVISDLALRVHIGVTEKEQRRSQKILVSVEMEPAACGEINDSIHSTIDYSAVRRGIKSLFGGEQINLIETVAARIARYILDEFRVKGVTVGVKKYPYRDTAHVGCRLSLGRPDGENTES